MTWVLRAAGLLQDGEETWMVASMTLYQAAYHGDVVELRRLVAAGVNVDAQDAHGHTALIWAAGAGHAEAIKTLVQLGANKEAKNIGRMTPVRALRGCRGARGGDQDVGAAWR
jgi:ankyrin repeat protein